jgi:RecB family endonuclease NucS
MENKQVFRIKSSDQLFKLFETEKLVREELKITIYENKEYPGSVDKTDGYHITISLRHETIHSEVVSAELPIQEPFKLIRDEKGK